MKPAAEMIVHSARGHFAQREQIHFERVPCVLAFGLARVKAREKIQRDGPRKFRCRAETAFARIKTAIELLIRFLENVFVDLCGRIGCGRLRFAQCFDDLRSAPGNFLMVLPPSR